MRKVILSLAIVALFLVGCVSSKINDKVENGKFLVKPTSLFISEEMKRLEPHLNMRSGAFDVMYNGEKKQIKTSLEIWENGKFKSESNEIMSYLEKGEPNFISLSLKDNLLLDDGSNTNNMQMTMTTSGSSIISLVEKYPEGYSTTIESIKEPINIDENEEVMVWALIGIKPTDDGSSSYSSKGNIEESILTSDWAIIIKINLE